MGKSRKEKSGEDKAKFVAMKTETNNDMVITVEGTEGRVYRFTMPFFSPLPEGYNASVNVANKIAELYNEAIERQKEKIAKEKEEAEKEENKDTSAADTSAA